MSNRKQRLKLQAQRRIVERAASKERARIAELETARRDAVAAIKALAWIKAYPVKMTRKPIMGSIPAESAYQTVHIPQVVDARHLVTHSLAD